MVMKKKLIAGAMAVTLCTTTAFSVQGAVDTETSATEEETTEAVVISAPEDVQLSEELAEPVKEDSAAAIEEAVETDEAAPVEEEAVEEEPVQEQASIEINADKQIVINGQVLKGSLYENQDQVIMLPLRELAQALDYVVVWNPEEKSAELFKGDSVGKVVLGSTNYVKGHQVLNLETAPELQDSLMYVPAAFFADVLDVQVVSVEENTPVTEEEVTNEEQASATEEEKTDSGKQATDTEEETADSEENTTATEE